MTEESVDVPEGTMEVVDQENKVPLRTFKTQKGFTLVVDDLN